MTETLDGVTVKKAAPEPTAEQAAAEELVRRAREQGLSLTGPDGLLKQLTKTVLETALTESSGQVTIEVPRDRAGRFEPQIVRKLQRRLTGVDEIVLSRYAKSA